LTSENRIVTSHEKARALSRADEAPGPAVPPRFGWLRRRWGIGRGKWVLSYLLHPTSYLRAEPIRPHFALSRAHPAGITRGKPLSSRGSGAIFGADPHPASTLPDSLLRAPRAYSSPS